MGYRRVGIEGRARKAAEDSRLKDLIQPQLTLGLALNSSKQASPSRLQPSSPHPQAKKGVTTGMKLTRPNKKTDDVNLDLTIMIDANEELMRETDRAPHKSALAHVYDPEESFLMKSSDVIYSPPATMHRNQARMIG